MALYKFRIIIIIIIISSLAQSAAFLTSVDIPKKITDYMAQFTRCSAQPQKDYCASWLQIASDHDALVENYLVNLHANCTRQRTPLLQVRTRSQCNTAISRGWVIFLRTCLCSQTKRRNLNGWPKSARSQLVRLY